MRLEWNAGGWFGTQLGGTLWILVAAVLVSARDPQTGMIVGAVFVAPNVVGSILWSRRARASCYSAIQTLLSVMGVASLLAVYVLERSSEWMTIQRGGTVGAGSTYALIVAVTLGLMLLFYVRFGRQRGR